MILETLDGLLALFGILVLGILVWAAISPFETLGWWAGWFGDKIYTDNLPSDGPVRSIHSDANAYFLFLSGIGRVSEETLSYREKGFLQRLAVELPNAVIIDDIFPYSVNNMALTGQPFFARFWKWVLQRKFKGPQIAGYMINIRNIWQVLISVDNRYGPLYNQGIAEVLLHHLLRYGYKADGDTPLFILGYSGSAQMGVGAVHYLREWIKAPIYFISLGGVFASEPGLLSIEHLYHFDGSKDSIQHLSLLAPGRWSIFPTSHWNRIRRQGRVTNIRLGPMGHTGRGGYLDAKQQLTDGTPFVDKTVKAIVSTVKSIISPTPAKPV